MEKADLPEEELSRAHRYRALSAHIKAVAEHECDSSRRDELLELSLRFSVLADAAASVALATRH